MAELGRLASGLFLRSIHCFSRDHLSESASSSAGTGRGILVTLSPSGYLRTVLQ